MIVTNRFRSPWSLRSRWRTRRPAAVGRSVAGIPRDGTCAKELGSASGSQIGDIPVATSAFHVLTNGIL